MSLTNKEIITKFGGSEANSGSTEVQVALLTNRINTLSEHFSKHKHDFHGKLGLMKMIGRRRRLLRFLSSKNHEGYLKLIAELGLRK